jgi:hypothetical protein
MTAPAGEVRIEMGALPQNSQNGQPTEVSWLGRLVNSVPLDARGRGAVATVGLLGIGLLLLSQLDIGVELVSDGIYVLGGVLTTGSFSYAICSRDQIPSEDFAREAF